MKIKCSFSIAFLLFCVCIRAQQKTTIATQKQQAEKYSNPILPFDFSDPDAIRVGNKYYMTASSFNASPGLPILESEDLVHWKLVNYALPKQVPLDTFDKPMYGKGVWAPAIRYHNQEFYIYYPDPDFGVYMIKTKNVHTAWSKPVLVLPGKGIIDPCPFWDDDGKAYLVTAWAASRAGVNNLLTIYPLHPNGEFVMAEGKHIFDGHDDNPTTEGPKLYKRNGYYYVFAPAGGVSTGWQLVLRSKHIYGPYECKKVMHQGLSTINGPHQGAWVTTPTAENWFLHFQDQGVFGRVVHLQPMIWKNDWPVIGIDKDGDGIGEPVLTYTMSHTQANSTSKSYHIPLEDNFDADTLALPWQWNANYKIQWYSCLPQKSMLRLFAIPQLPDAVNLASCPNLLLQKIPASSFEIETKLSLKTGSTQTNKKRAGLIMAGLSYATVYIHQQDSVYYMSYSICNQALKQHKEQMLATFPLNKSEAVIKASFDKQTGSCSFSFSTDGINYTQFDKTFKLEEGYWIGAKAGLYCVSDNGTKAGGYADIDWFNIKFK